MEKKKAGKSEKTLTVNEFTETLQRMQADFENYKKQVEKDRECFRQYAKAEVLEKLLPIIDSLEIALKNNSNHERFVKGIELIFAELYSLIEKEGVKPIGALGKQFDPYRHEVLLTEESEQDGIVLEELQKGYMLKDRVLRHAKVKIGKKSEQKREGMCCEDSKADAKEKDS